VVEKTTKRQPWQSHPDVLDAFASWVEAHTAVEKLRQLSQLSGLDTVDPRLRAAQQKALSAWHMYEAEREAAGGPHAGIV
jgi:hypothetical protein